MESLGVFDQLFYKADQHKVASMIMGGVSILAPARSGGRLKAETIANHLAARLEQIPLLRQKLVQDPLRLGSVFKVEDPDFDVFEHIDTARLKGKGGYAELTACIGEFSSEPLAEGILWRWKVVEGLEGGRVAVMCKLHHALADGIGATRVLSSMYDEKPVRAEKPKGRSGKRVESPGDLALLSSAVLESTRRAWLKTPQFLFSNSLPLLSAAGSAALELARSADKRRELFDQPDVQPTSLNTAESAGRRAIAYKTLSLKEVKQTARKFNATVNDIGLLLFSYALQHYFESTTEEIDFDLWCGVPISTRTDDSSGGNQVSAGRVCLHNTIEDVRERLRAIQADAAEIKRKARPEKPLLEAGEIAGIIQPLALEGLFYLAARFNLMGRAAGGMTVFNALLSNVPGPPQTFYVANAVLEETIPLIPVVDIMALSGGIASMGDSITLGFHCDADVVENPDLFIEGVEVGLAALED